MPFILKKKIKKNAAAENDIMRVVTAKPENKNNEMLISVGEVKKGGRVILCGFVTTSDLNHVQAVICC